MAQRIFLGNSTGLSGRACQRVCSRRFNSCLYTYNVITSNEKSRNSVFVVVFESRPYFPNREIFSCADRENDRVLSPLSYTFIDLTHSMILKKKRENLGIEINFEF